MNRDFKGVTGFVSTYESIVNDWTLPNLLRSNKIIVLKTDLQTPFFGEILVPHIRLVVIKVLEEKNLDHFHHIRFDLFLKSSFSPTPSDFYEGRWGTGFSIGIGH